MTLFDECKEALSSDFSEVKGQGEKDALNILYRYPFANGNINWTRIEYSDYESINGVLRKKDIKNNKVFVFADDMSIPVFRTNLILIAENIYDVTALSTKLFIFNNELILQPLFPTEMIRLGINH